jgi:hypothetical protein
LDGKGTGQCEHQDDRQEAAIPGVTVEAIQQALALDFVGAFDTVTTAIGDSVVAVGQPLLDSLIWRSQKAHLVNAAVPRALIDIANGVLEAGNGVAVSLIEGTQNLVAAIVTLNLSNIINAAVEGTQNFVAALGAGAGSIVSGIESAQLGISTALATTPPPPPSFASVTDVVALQTLSVDNTVSLTRSAKTVTIDAVAPAKDELAAPEVVDTVSDSSGTADVVKDIDPSPQKSKPVTEVVDTPAKVEPQDASKAPTVDATPDSNPAAPIDPPKARAGHLSPVKDDLNEAKPTTGVRKTGADDKDAGVKKDADPDRDGGADAKLAKDAGSE